MVLEATDVVREYETGGETVRALKGVDVTIDPGEFVAVVGPSGSGKSTLLNLLGLLDVPTSGEVTYRDRAVATLSDRERTRLRKDAIGFVFQSFQLLPTLTAKANVEVPGWIHHSTSTSERAADLLERVGLGDRLDHRPDQLSGGQKQRVAIARSLINEPDVVLADEPTGNLDRETGRQILGEFERITERDVAVVAVTHDEIVEEYADRTVQLIDGHLDRVEGEAIGTDTAEATDTDEQRSGGEGTGTAERTDAAGERSGREETGESGSSPATTEGARPASEAESTEGSR